MTHLRIAILSSQSLFAEGLAARLRQHLGEQELHVVDARQTDAIQRLLTVEPAAVILDEMDKELEGLCPLNSLLGALPGVTIIRVTAQQAQVQLITSEQRPLAGVNELVKVLKNLPAGA